MNPNASLRKSLLILANVSLVFVILFLLSKTTDFLQPIYSVILFLLAPLILSLYVFYALRPLRIFLTKVTKRPSIAAILTFLVFIALLVGLFGLLSSLFYTQISEIVTRLLVHLDFTDLFDAKNPLFDKVGTYVKLEKVTQALQERIQKFALSVPNRMSSIFSGVGNFGTQLLMGLLCIFYLLKDESLAVKTLHGFLRGPYETELTAMFAKIHETLKTYISGQLTVAAVLGGLMFIGYLIIGLPYAFLMSVLALVTNFIPFIGPILGALPAILIAFTIDLPMVIKVIAVTVIVQQCESNLITPNIMGSKLDIHPFVVIVVVLVCMNLFGVLGALIATPLYLMLITIIKTLIAISYKKKNLCPVDFSTEEEVEE